MSSEKTKKFSWDENYAYLKKFKEEHGRFPTVEENSRIHNWLRYQRYRYRRADLNMNKAKMLEDLGFPMKKNNNDILWEQRYELLEVHVANGNNPNVEVRPTNQGVEKILGRWLSKQRYNFRKGILPMDKAQKLEKLGVYFSNQQYHFEKKYAELKKFYKKHGHYDIPHQGKTKRLREWVNHVRSYKKHRLTKDQLQALADINFEWKSKTQRLREAREMEKKINLNKEMQSIKASKV